MASQRKIIIDYRSGFRLPSGRTLIQRNSEDFEDGDFENPLLRVKFEDTGIKKLVRDEVLILDPRRIKLYRERRKVDLFEVTEKLRKRGLLPLDYGVCSYFLNHLNKIPKQLREVGRSVFAGEFIGWTHPYTGFFLEHVVEEVPVFEVSKSGARVEVEDCICDNADWNLNDIPLAIYQP